MRDWGAQDMSDLETFGRYAKTEFEVEDGQGSVIDFTLTLMEVNRLSDAARHPEAERDPFSLIFTGPHSPYLPQGAYTFRHAELGNFVMFIVPIGPGEAGMRYEAIFT
jgi:hypothetical protein